MAQRPARKLVPKGFAHGVRRPSAVFKIQVCGESVIFRALGLHIQVNHAFFVQRSFEPAQSTDGVRGRGRSKQEDGVILWEKPKIVFENHQIVFFNLCIGRISVLYVN